MPPPPPKKPPTRPPPPAAEPEAQRVVRLREPVKRAPAILFNAVEGWGKTTIAAHAPSPLILMSGSETGYDTLLSNGLVPQVPAEVVESWPDTLAWVRSLTRDPQGVKTLAFDAAGGFETLCREYVCDRDFKGDYGESGFQGYGRGYAIVEREWKGFVAGLEQLRDRHGVQILMLSHVRVEMFKNPTGADYSRYISDVHQKVWGVTAKFMDAVLFGTFYQLVEADRANNKKNIAERRGKVVGEAQRVVVTTRRDGFDAKNRYAMPDEIYVEGAADRMYHEIWQHINGGE